MLSWVWLSAFPWPEAHQARLSMGLSWQEYCSGLPFLLQGIFPTQGSNPRPLHWQADSLPLSHLGSPTVALTSLNINSPRSARGFQDREQQLDQVSSQRPSMLQAHLSQMHTTWKWRSSWWTLMCDATKCRNESSSSYVSRKEPGTSWRLEERTLLPEPWPNLSHRFFLAASSSSTL